MEGISECCISVYRIPNGMIRHEVFCGIRYTIVRSQSGVRWHKMQNMEKPVKRVLLTVAYDGSAYHGWQIQPNGDTIEAQLNTHLSALCGEPIAVTGASRTDAGVHALCNLAVFDTHARMPAEKFCYALNQRLPEDIRIQKSEEVAPDFHPRKIKTRKTYEYKIYNAQFQNPVHRLYSYFTYASLDVEKMRRAASYLIGEHDFFSLSTYKPEVESTVRTIYEIEVLVEPMGYAGAGLAEGSGTEQEKRSSEGTAENIGCKMPQMITIRVTGNGFLYNMVRIIAGTLLEVGRGRISLDAIPSIIEARDRQLAGPTAPACGLTLVYYEIEKAE